MKNNKGFTLVEILATITIIGIISIIAIPTVNNSITSSRKESFVSMAKNYIKQARNELIGKNLAYKKNKDIVCKLPSEDGKYTLINIKDIELENNSQISPFKKSLEGYVIAVNKKNKIAYFIAMIDKGKNGIDQFIEESKLTKDKIKKQTAITDNTKNYQKNLRNTITITDETYGGDYSLYMECEGIYEE